MSKLIKNASEQQIIEAMEIVNKSNANISINADRYAMTEYDTIVNVQGGMLVSMPKGMVKAIKCITVYGDTCASVHYILEGVSMFSQDKINKCKFIPVAQDEIPNHFKISGTYIRYE